MADNEPRDTGGSQMVVGRGFEYMHGAWCGGEAVQWDAHKQAVQHSFNQGRPGEEKKRLACCNLQPGQHAAKDLGWVG